jgi:hypothetical protein
METIWRNLVGIVASADEQVWIAHEGYLRLREVNAIYEIFVDTVLVNIANDPDDSGPRLTIVFGDAVADGTFFGPIVFGHLRVNDGNMGRVAGISVGEGVAREHRNAKCTEVVGGASS